VLSLILDKCLHFFNIFAVFLTYYKQNILFAYCCYEESTGGVSFANKNISGLQKYLRFQNEYNKVEIELRIVQVWTES
jgi:hypothetical protein